MVEQAAEDYAKIFQTANLEREIHPICNNIEDMLARLDEFETLLSSVKAETNGIIENHVKYIVSINGNFQALQERIDNLEHFVEVVNANVNAVERSVDIAEEELNVTDYSLKGLLLKPLLAKAKASTGDNSENIRSNMRDGEFQAVPIFKSSDYFSKSDLDAVQGPSGSTTRT